MWQLNLAGHFLPVRQCWFTPRQSIELYLEGNHIQNNNKIYSFGHILQTLHANDYQLEIYNNLPLFSLQQLICEECKTDTIKHMNMNK